VKVIDSNFSAQYGHTSGGFIEYTTKSGSDTFHGSAYDYYNYQGLNARGELIADRSPVQKNDWGFAVGGPIYIPKVFNGRKHQSYFFVDFDLLHYNQGFLPNFGNTNPQSQFLTGDFSQLLTGFTSGQVTQIGTDILGRPVYEGEIFNPATSRTVNGVKVRDGYGFDPVTGLPITGLANIIPANDPLRSAIAAKMVPLFQTQAVPQRPGLINNGVVPSGNKWIYPKTLFVRWDQSVKTKLKMSTSVNANTRPSLRQCSGSSEGCDTSDPHNYIGQGFYQDITTRTIHQQFDWIMKPNLFNHTTVSFDRWVLPATPISANQNWPQRLGLIGPFDPRGGFPGLYFYSNLIPYSFFGQPCYQCEGNNANRWQFLDDISWIKGKHTITAGIEYRHHQFPEYGSGNTSGIYNFSWQETGGYDAHGNQITLTGDPFASWLLGQVDNSNFNINGSFLFNEAYVAPWVNDSFKVTKNLTLTLGLRWDYQTGLSESYNHMSTFSPTVPNPAAGNLPGAMIFAGSGSGLSGLTAFEKPSKDAWGPRFGFAYRINDATSVRGGYGIYYGGISTDQFTGQPTLGFSTNPTVPNVTSGFKPAFYWDTGYPSSVIKFPPTIDPTVSNGTGPYWVTPDSRNLPRYQNWSLTVERQVGANLLLDVAYVGNHGTRLTENANSLGIADNMNNPSILALGPSLLSADIHSSAAQAAGIKSPYPGFVGDVAQALRPYPQYQVITVKSVPTGYSIYHGLTAKVEKRFSGGLIGRVAYTYSKLINNGAEDEISGDGVGIQNPALGQADKRSLSRDNVPQSLIIAWSYELPFGKGKRFAGSAGGALNALISGWQIAASQRYDSGRPLGITMACDTCTYLFSDSKRPNRLSGVSGLLAYGSHFDPNAEKYLNLNGWADPGALQFGNASREDPSIRDFAYYNEDLNLAKDTRVTERVTIRFEAQFGNLFNRHLWCDPNTNWSAGPASFGLISGQCDQPRNIQGGLRLEF